MANTLARSPLAAILPGGSTAGGLAFTDLTLARRAGVKGPAARAWLDATGYGPLPAPNLAARRASDGLLVAMLGESEALLLDRAGTAPLWSFGSGAAPLSWRLPGAARRGHVLDHNRGRQRARHVRLRLRRRSSSKIVRGFAGGADDDRQGERRHCPRRRGRKFRLSRARRHLARALSGTTASHGGGTGVSLPHDFEHRVKSPATQRAQRRSKSQTSSKPMRRLNSAKAEEREAGRIRGAFGP